MKIPDASSQEEAKGAILRIVEASITMGWPEKEIELFVQNRLQISITFESDRLTVSEGDLETLASGMREFSDPGHGGLFLSLAPKLKTDLPVGAYAEPKPFALSSQRKYKRTKTPIMPVVASNYTPPAPKQTPRPLAMSRNTGSQDAGTDEKSPINFGVVFLAIIVLIILIGMMVPENHSGSDVRAENAAQRGADKIDQGKQDQLTREEMEALARKMHYGDKERRQQNR